MTDNRPKQASARQAPRQAPTPHLQTRPATMITAIGLCAIIVLIQLVPEIQSVARFSASTIATAR